MKIKTVQTVTMETVSELDTSLLKVIRTNNPDIDSVNLEVYYNNADDAIGYGHLNNRTNTAHITINENLLNEVDECNLMDFIVDGIESRSINLD